MSLKRALLFLLCFCAIPSELLAQLKPSRRPLVAAIHEFVPKDTGRDLLIDGRPFQVQGRIDRAFLESLGRRKMEPASICSDEVFIRRVDIDVLGTLPRADEVREFLADKTKQKRRKLIEEFLARPEFVDFQTMRWCDVLRVKAEMTLTAKSSFDGRPTELRLEAIAVIDGREIVRPVIAVDNREQAFIYHHLAPAKSFVVARFFRVRRNS